MGEGERFRFMQIKMDGERPGFIVLKHEGGKYYIQLNVKENDLTKTKTGWYLLTNEPHLIEVSWQAASAPGANDGYALLYIDELLQESLLGLDTDELYISDFRMGFTSRLVGKSITGIFYLEDVGTSISGYLGAP
jgi:hypothetical protein